MNFKKIFEFGKNGNNGNGKEKIKTEKKISDNSTDNIENYKDMNLDSTTSREGDKDNNLLENEN